jgi:hypothetical protein
MINQTLITCIAVLRIITFCGVVGGYQLWEEHIVLIFSEGTTYQTVRSQSL